MTFLAQPRGTRKQDLILQKCGITATFSMPPRNAANFYFSCNWFISVANMVIALLALFFYLKLKISCHNCCINSSTTWHGKSNFFGGRQNSVMPRRENWSSGTIAEKREDRNEQLSLLTCAAHSPSFWKNMLEPLFGYGWVGCEGQERGRVLICSCLSFSRVVGNFS